MSTKSHEANQKNEPKINIQSATRLEISVDRNGRIGTKIFEIRKSLYARIKKMTSPSRWDIRV